MYELLPLAFHWADWVSEIWGAQPKLLSFLPVSTEFPSSSLTSIPSPSAAVTRPHQLCSRKPHKPLYFRLRSPSGLTWLKPRRDPGRFFLQALGRSLLALQRLGSWPFSLPSNYITIASASIITCSFLWSHHLPLSLRTLQVTCPSLGDPRPFSHLRILSFISSAESLWGPLFNHSQRSSWWPVCLQSPVWGPKTTWDVTGQKH